MDLRGHAGHESAVVQRAHPISARISADYRHSLEPGHARQYAAGAHQHAGHVSVTARLHRKPPECRYGRNAHHRCRLLGCGLPVAPTPDVHRSRAVDQVWIVSAMPVIEPTAPLRLLRAGYALDDWVAVFLKSYATGETCQRVASISQVSRPEFLAWLRSRNASAWNVYVSVNSVSPQSRSRSRQFVAAIRHVFLEADEDGPQVLARIAARADLPPPSYLLHSSRHRVHVFWRVSGFDTPGVEALQKQLARELRTDTAATSCSQLTRLPGLFNHKRHPAELVTMVYGDVGRVYGVSDFPAAKVRV